MKILLIHNYYQMSGGENSVFENLIRILKRFGQEVEVYARHNLEASYFNPQSKARAIIDSFFSLRTWREVREIVQQKRPQVAIVQNVFPLISPSVYYALKSKNVPIVQAVYNYRFVCPNAHLFTQGRICERCVRGSHWNAVARQCYRNSFVMSGWYAAILSMHRRVDSFARNIDVFMIPDEFMRGILVKGGIPSVKIKKNVNPFFVDDYQPCYEKGDFILYVGRIVRQKGVFTLVRAMSKVTSSNLKLYIVGEGEDKADLETLINQLNLQNRVIILGPKWGDEVRSLISASSFVVIPSEWYDNLPLILCQAYATAKPVIASAINGIPEYVTHEMDGLLFKPSDDNELAQCIDRLSTDTSLLARMSVNARRKAEEVFDFRAYWHTLYSIIQELV